MLISTRDASTRDEVAPDPSRAPTQPMLRPSHDIYGPFFIPSELVVTSYRTILLLSRT